MATSSITANFVVEGDEQVQMFANAIEESYQESLTRDNSCHVEYDEITSVDKWDDFMAQWREMHGHK